MTREKAIELFKDVEVLVFRDVKQKYFHEDIEEAFKLAIKALEQEPKTGHWILADIQIKEDIENDNYLFICSECQCSDIHAKGVVVPYCWKCGAKMIELQESEGKK